MRSIMSIARITFIQQLRNRLYLVVLFFAALLLGVSLLFGALASDQALRVILDFGLATTELFGLVTAVFGAVSLVLEEMESRTLYLILTRPLPRAFYIVGRFIGLLAAVWASMILMCLLHLGLLFLKGWEADPGVLAGIPFMFAKIAMVAGIAIFFSLFSTSTVASVVFTFFFWLLGHFGPELRHLAAQSDNALTGFLVKAVLFLTPNFAWFTARDIFHVPGVSLPGDIAMSLGYALLYTCACLLLSTALFSRKEF